MKRRAAIPKLPPPRITKARRLPSPAKPALPESLAALNAAPLRRHFAALVG